MKEVIISDIDWIQTLWTLSVPKDADEVAIILHGFSSSKESKLYIDLEKELNNKNIWTFRIDYYGHWKLYCENTKFTVSKDITLTKCINSLKTAIKYIRDLGNYDISLVWASFGWLICMIVTWFDANIKKIVLKSAVTEPISFWNNRLDKNQIFEWKNIGILHYDDCWENFELNYEFYEDLYNYDTFELAQKINADILILHWDQDRVVPIEQTYKFADSINQKVNVINWAGHLYRDSNHYNQMKKLIVDFF